MLLFSSDLQESISLVHWHRPVVVFLCEGVLVRSDHRNAVSVLRFLQLRAKTYLENVIC